MSNYLTRAAAMFSSPTKSDGSGSPRRPQTPTPLAPPSAAPDTRPKIDQGQARVDLGKAQEFVAIFTECLRYDTAESAEAARDKSDTTQASPSPSKKSNTSPMKFSPTKKGSPKEGKPVAAAVRELVGTPLAKFQQELGRTRPVVIDLDDHEIFWNAPDKEEILGKVHASETSKAEAETWASRLAKPESHFILEALQSARKLFCRVISHSLLELDIGGLPMLIRHVKTGAFVATPWFYVGKTRWTVQLYPNAKSKADAGFLSVFLQRMPPVTNCNERFRYEVWISNPDDPTAVRGMKTDKDTIIGNLSGAARFMKHSEIDKLPNSDKSLYNNSGTVRVTVLMLQLDQGTALKTDAVQKRDTSACMSLKQLKDVVFFRGLSAFGATSTKTYQEISMSILKKATAHWQNAASAFVGATSAVFDQHVATDLKKQMHQYQLFTLGSKIARIAMDTLAEVESEYAANVHSIIELEVAVMLDTDRDDVNMLSQLAAGRVLQPRLRRALSADQSLAHANAIPRKEIPSYPDPVAETISCVSEVLIRWEEAYSRINVHLMCAFYNAFVSAYSRKMDVKMARLVNCMKQNSESEWVRRLNATGSSHVSAIGTASTLTLARLVLPGETGELDMPKDVPKDTDQLTSPKRRPLLPPRNISLEKSLIKFEERVIRMCMPESLTRWFELVSVEFRKLGL